MVCEEQKITKKNKNPYLTFSEEIVPEYQVVMCKFTRAGSTVVIYSGTSFYIRSI